MTPPFISPLPTLTDFSVSKTINQKKSTWAHSEISAYTGKGKELSRPEVWQSLDLGLYPPAFFWVTYFYCYLGHFPTQPDQEKASSNIGWIKQNWGHGDGGSWLHNEKPTSCFAPLLTSYATPCSAWRSEELQQTSTVHRRVCHALPQAQNHNVKIERM